MILNFGIKFKSEKRTFFVERILNNDHLLHSFLSIYDVNSIQEFSKTFAKHDYEVDYSEFVLYKKIHTIRQDRRNRWKGGAEIEFTINEGTEKEFVFTKGECISVQSIEIIYPDVERLPTLEKVIILIDGKPLNQAEKEQLAINDGFESLNDFYDYFDNDFKGKIIHWTNFKY